jgi:hypothetical protein
MARCDARRAEGFTGDTRAVGSSCKDHEPHLAVLVFLQCVMVVSGLNDNASGVSVVDLNGPGFLLTPSPS